MSWRILRSWNWLSNTKSQPSLGIYRDAVLHHTISRKSFSSTVSGVPGRKVPGKSRSWYCKLLRFLSRSVSLFRNFACTNWPQSAWRRCQILWILEEYWGWFTSSRNTLKKRFLRYPTSSVCEAASKNRGQSFLWDSDFSWVDWERGIVQSCSQFEDPKHSLASFKEFTLSCNSWIWAISWFFCWIRFLLHRGLIEFQLSSSISFYKSKFFVILQCLFSLWAWSGNWFAW